METSEYTVECPKYKLECDIESCPRFLVSTSIGYNKDGELIGSGFCNEHGHRYFKDIPQEKIQFKQEEQEPSAIVTQSNPLERTTKIEPPDFKDRDSCEMFCKRLFAELKEKKKDSLHTAREIVYYMLHGAKEGELYYDDCLVARRIQKEWNWELPTFTTYCKRKNIPTPKGISRAAKKHATQKRVRRDLRGL